MLSLYPFESITVGWERFVGKVIEGYWSSVVMPSKVIDVLFCWIGLFQRHNRRLVWNAPLCITWTI